MKEDVSVFVGRIIKAAGFDLSVEVDDLGGDEPGSIRVTLSGSDRGLLLGRNAELLDALEYITNRTFGRQLSHDGKIAFDSGNYRALREQELKLMAEKAAERVRSSRTAFTFDAMSPSERRIIHLTLGDDRTVRTESVGDGTERKVKVFPA
jgi:spoIIIJ-associated protein